MRIRWTVPAADDLENIKKFLLKNYPHFAEPTVRVIYRRIRARRALPWRGRPGHRSGTRESPLTPRPCVVVYSLNREPSKSWISTTGRSTGAKIRTAARLADAHNSSTAALNSAGAPACGRAFCACRVVHVRRSHAGETATRRQWRRARKFRRCPVRILISFRSSVTSHYAKRESR